MVLAAGAGLATLILAIAPFRDARGQHLVLALLACGPILLLRRWPLPILAGVAAASALVISSGTAPLPMGVLLALATYFVASRLPRRVSVSAVLLTASGLGIALLHAVVAESQATPAILAVESYLPLAAAWFVGDAVAARRRYVAGLVEQAERRRLTEAERLRREVRDERVRIAQELHDVVAHTLAVITVQAGVGRRLMHRRPEHAANALESIEAIGRTAQEELRVVLGLLREEGVSAELSPAPRLLDLKALVGTIQASGTEVEIQLSGLDRQLSPALELSLYRVVQEALTNVVKHAPGARALVTVAVADHRVRVEVVDDGGNRPPGPPGRSGHGIVGMRERVAAFGGSLTAHPAPGGGFRVIAEVPIEATR